MRGRDLRSDRRPVYKSVMGTVSGSSKQRLSSAIAGLAGLLWWRRAMTLGVRIIVVDGDDIFLVRHTYRAGWYLPGGAVDRGESAEAAALRELLEEGGIRGTSRPELFHFYRNGTGAARDHVALYIVRAFTRDPGWQPDHEIAEAGFFPMTGLPGDTTPATRARIAEFLGETVAEEHW